MSTPTIPPVPDQALIIAYQQGSTQAITILFERYKAKIFTAIFLLVKDKFLAEDIFQESFIKIIDTIRSGKYNEEGKFLPWALRIARNLCLDYFRKAKRVPLIKSGNDRDIFEVINYCEPGTDELMAHRETCHELMQMLDRLPEEQREVIFLRHFADLSFKEIATLTGCSINTALGRMRYGLLNMRKMAAGSSLILVRRA